MNFGAKAYGGDRVIVRRRIEENKRAALRSAVLKNYHLGSVAKWEESSAKLMNNKQQQRQHLQSQKKKQLDLEIRKKKLCRLLAEEELIFKQEIDNKSETPQQKKVRLEKKALDLKTKRIKRREQFVAQQRLKQFRGQCDELRLNAGHNLTMECDRIRKHQIAEKQLQKEYEKGVDDHYLKKWKGELQKKIDRETREAKYKKRLNDDTANAIQKQMKVNDDQRKKNKEIKQKDVEQRVSKLRETEENNRLQSIQIMKDRVAKREERVKEYEMFQQKKIDEDLLERKLDKEFIERVLKAETEESKSKEGVQQKNKEKIQNYLAYLAQLKEKEAENERLLEKLRQNEQENAWGKREDKWKKEDFARQQLLKNVLDGRQDQIYYKQCMEQNNSKQDTFESQRMLKDIELYNVSEKKKIEDRLQYNKQIQQFLRLQIEEKTKAEAHKSVEFDVDAEKKREYNKLLQQETEKDRLQIQQGKSMHHYPKTTANWFSY